MKELGHIILKNGRIIKFGEFYCGIQRDSSNKKHFHNSAFKEVLSQNIEDFPFIDNVEDFQLSSKLDFLAQHQCIAVLNITQGTFTADYPGLMIVNPDSISEEQREALISEESTINFFDNGFFCISVVDKDGKIVDEYNDIDRFYKDVVHYDYQSTFSLDNPIVQKIYH